MTRPACSIPDCPRLAMIRGWCVPHYDRWRKTGNPFGVRGGPVYPPGYRPPPAVKHPKPDPHWGYGLPGNPWAGNRPCPQCSSDRWTMPTDGRWHTRRWVCVNIFEHETLFFTLTKRQAA